MLLREMLCAERYSSVEHGEARMADAASTRRLVLFPNGPSAPFFNFNAVWLCATGPVSQKAKENKPKLQHDRK